MSQDALGLLKHLKTARARWPFPDAGGVSSCSHKALLKTGERITLKLSVKDWLADTYYGWVFGRAVKI